MNKPYPFGVGFTKKLISAATSLVAVLLCAVIVIARPVAAVTPGFVQGKAQAISTGTTNNLAFTSANGAGNLIVAYVVWNNTGTVSLSDSRNTYTAVAQATKFNGNQGSSQVFYAKNIGAGANTVRATFGTSISSFGILYIHEYSGIDKVNPLDVTSAASGTTSAMNSGSATTTNANDLIFGAGVSSNSVTAMGSGFTSRSTFDGNRTMDKIVATTGSYNATATQSGNAWAMHMVAFKADSGTIDTTAPSVPTGVTATAVSTSQINLGWTASTDNVGVTGYKIFRDGTQIATTAGTTYQNTGLTASTTYSYTVAAYDAAGNTSAPSAAAVATTQTPDTTAPVVSVTAPAEGQVLTGTVTVTATASDNVAVTKVEFYVDDQQLENTDTTSPYGFSLDSTTLPFGTHTITARAYDAANNITTSTPVNVTVDNVDYIAPSVPTGLTATAASTSQINLSWTASTDNIGVTGYNILRDGVQVATTAGTTYQDAGLAASTAYDYTVAAFDAAGNASASSIDASATTLTPDTTAPSVPTDLAAVPASSSAIDLSWTASTDNIAVTGYRIFRDGVQIATTPGTSYQNTGLSPQADYGYAVSAFDAAGNDSGISTTIVATTQATAGTAFPLKLSTNGRYLVDQNNVPFLMNGDSPQGLIVRLPISGAASSETYLADREAHGFNTIWVNLLARADNGGNSSGMTFDGVAPFMSQDDISVPNPVYFQRAHDMIAQAATHHILVVLDPIETIDHLGVLRANGATKDQNYGAFVGNYFKDLPNIIWMSGNDYAYNTSDDAYTLAVVQGIKSTDRADRLQTVELYPTPVGSLADPSWTPYINIDMAYTYAPAYAQVLTEYNRALNTSNGTMPTFLIESYYDYEQIPPINNHAQPDSTYRNQEYWTALSGAAGQVYGNYYTVRFPSGWNNTANLDTPTVTQLGYLNGLLGSFNWYDLVPDQTDTFLTGGQGEYIGYVIHNADGSLKQNDYSTAALTADGHTGLIYVPTPRTITVNMSKLADQVTARWFDPTTNTFSNIGTYANSGSRQFTPPSIVHADGARDWILVLTTAPAAPDTSAPSVPTGLNATAASSTSVNLSWTASTDNVGVTGYKIFRDGVQVGTATTNSYADAGLTASTTYTYTVRAYDAAANTSVDSTSASATTQSPDTTPPVISATSTTNITGSSAKINWTTDETADSQVEYGLTAGYGTSTTLNSNLVTTHTQNLSGLSASTIYHYRVLSKDASGNLTASGDNTFTTTAVAAAPQFVQTANVTNDAVATNISRAFTTSNTAGNLIAVAVTWDGNTGAPICSDSQGNTYTVANYQFDSTMSQSLAICYAPNIKAGANTVTVTFGSSRPYRRMVISEYSGVGAVDVTAQNIATATTAVNGATSGSATTTVSGDLIFGAIMDDSSTTTIVAGTGFTQRNYTNNKDLAAQDMVQAAAGSVASTQTMGAAHHYLAQMVAFKAVP